MLGKRHIAGLFRQFVDKIMGYFPRPLLLVKNGHLTQTDAGRADKSGD
jgi:hypothetical protein